MSFSEIFNVTFADPNNPTAQDIFTAITSVGTNLKADTKNLNDKVKKIGKEMEGMKNETKEVKKDVNRINDIVRKLEKRVEELEKGGGSGAAVPIKSAEGREKASATDEAKRILVFYPVTGYVRDQATMLDKMDSIYENFSFPPEFRRLLRNARIFQTNDGKRTDSVHVEYESPWQAKRVLTSTKGRNTWKGSGDRVNTRIFIPGVLRQRADVLETLGVKLREIGRAPGNEQISTQIRYVLNALAMFIRVGEEKEFLAVSEENEEDPRSAILNAKDRYKAKEDLMQKTKAGTEARRKRKVGKSVQPNVDGDPGSPSDTSDNDDFRSEKPKEKLRNQKRRKPAETLWTTPLHHHNINNKPTSLTNHQNS